ncbi:MAG: hypothetical protein WAV30_03530 [Microgenomates group bacterium]
MSNLIQQLSSVITSKPDVLQFAKDRKFEEAWVISLDHKRPTEDDIQQYINKEPFTVMIVEFVWNSKDDDSRFVLTLFLDKKCKLQDPAIFINMMLNQFYAYGGFTALVDILNSEIVGHSYILEEKAEGVNLSVFNHWLSVGPIDLWKQGEKYDALLVSQKIASRPDIEQTKLNYQGLFFRFNISGDSNGPYYGIKTPCCKKIGDTWHIDYAKVDYWMRLLLDSNKQ